MEQSPHRLSPPRDGRRTGVSTGNSAALHYIDSMRPILTFIASAIILAALFTLGAVFLLIFVGVIAGLALFFYLRMKLTGKPPAGMRFYRYEQRVREESAHSSPEIKVIEAEFEEIGKR